MFFNINRAKQVLFVMTVFLTLHLCSLHPTVGWTAEQVMIKTDGIVITASMNYKSGDVIRITGDRLVDEDWTELKKMWTVPFHLIFDNGQTEIPEMALSTNGMISVPAISITGKDVSSVGRFAFANNNHLTSVDFPALKSIAQMAFFSCMSLRVFQLPETIESLEDGVFAMCKKLEFINVADGNGKFKSIDGVVYGMDGNTLFVYPAGKREREFSSNVLIVRPFSFYGAENLERVSFSAVDSMGGGAFIMCARLASVALPDSLKTIGYGVFDSCLALTEIALPKNLESLGDGAFSYCENLLSISVAPDNEHFKSIDGILYSADGETLYAYPAGKRNAAFTTNAKEIRPYAFMYAGNIETVSLPYATSIGEGAFAWCSSLTAASLPSANSFGNGTFAWCNNLKLMELGNKMPEIEEKTFTSNETSFLIVTQDAEMHFDLERWPVGVKLATLRGSSSLGSIVVKQDDKLSLSLDILGAKNYQWKKNNVPLSGANEAFYSKPRAALEDSGTYAVTFKFDMGVLSDFEIGGIEVIVLQK